MGGRIPACSEWSEKDCPPVLKESVVQLLTQDYRILGANQSTMSWTILGMCRFVGGACLNVAPLRGYTDLPGRTVVSRNRVQEIL